MFLPSVNGFKFDNMFAPLPLVKLWKFGLGNASNGLCGGMVFAAADYYYNKLSIPENDTPPGENDKLFDYIVKRFMHSVHLPLGGLKVYLWSLYNHTKESYEIEVPKIINKLVYGPVPIILIKIQTLNPLDLGHNHQVLVYDGYWRNGKVVLRIYDPNYNCDDNIEIICSKNRLDHTYYGQVYGIFLNPYVATLPI